MVLTITLQVFAIQQKNYPEDIVSSASYRLNTSILEGTNNKIKVLKRMAYGYRDKAYFFLKIKDALPVKRDEPKKGPVAPLIFRTQQGLFEDVLQPLFQTGSG